MNWPLRSTCWKLPSSSRYFSDDNLRHFEKLIKPEIQTWLLLHAPFQMQNSSIVFICFRGSFSVKFEFGLAVIFLQPLFSLSIYSNFWWETRRLVAANMIAARPKSASIDKNSTSETFRIRILLGGGISDCLILPDRNHQWVGFCITYHTHIHLFKNIKNHRIWCFS